MPRSRRSTVPFLALSGVLLAGCGGGRNDSDGGDIRATTGITIAWGERTRAVVTGSAPLSARVSFTTSGTTSTPLVYTIDRRDTLAAYTETVFAPAKLQTGAAALQIDFFAGRGATGALVATTMTNAVIASDGTLTKADGSPLGTVVADSKIVGVTIQSPASVEVGATATLGATALDAEGNLVAITPGSFSFSVVGDASTATVTPAGLVTGLLPGTVSVRASLDGIVSPAAPLPVRLRSTNGIVVIEEATTDLAYSSALGRLFVATGTQGEQPNSVLSYTPDAGALDGVYRLGVPVGPLAASADGRIVYVAQNDQGRIVRIDVGTGAVTTPILLGTASNGEPLVTKDLEVSPADPNLVAVSKALVGVNPDFQELSLYAGSTEVSATTSTTPAADSIAYSPDGTELLTLEGQSGSYFLTSYGAAATGLTRLGQRPFVVNRLGVTIQYAGELAYGSDGTVFAPARLTAFGRFAIAAPLAPFAVDAAANRAYYVSQATTGLLVETFDATSYAKLSSKVYEKLLGTPSRVVLAGPNRIAVSVESRVYVLDLTKA